MKAQAWLSLLVVTACSRGGDRLPPAQSRSADTGMANMPGMASATDVTLTAAQVANGGVHWEPVALSPVAPVATVPGQVTPNEDRTARLGATVRGRVIAVHVRPGDRVGAGRVLVTLQSPEAGMAQSDVDKARAQASYARSARERAERLLALKAIPQQDYDRAIADDELASAELRRAKSVAEQIGAAASATGEIAIRSPLKGVVLARTAVPGTVIEAGTPLVVVTDPSSLWLSIDAPENLASLFRVGAQLRFTVPAYPADTFSARIDAIGAGLDPSTRTLPIRGVIRNRGERLKPEMLASVSAQGSGMVATPSVPEDAVQLLDGKSVVFVAHPNETGGAHFVPRDVQLGSRSGGRIAITQGLAAGDVIVTRGALAIKAQIKKGAMPEMEM
jgi:cobalt-zinc-cadmium efflux system membrane fusion protein